MFKPYDLSLILQRQNDISMQLVRGQENNLLPNKDLKTFDGSDVLLLKTFMLQFERAIEARCPGDEDKLLYLEQYTTGKAKTLLQSCNHYDPKIASKKPNNCLPKSVEMNTRLLWHILPS